MLDMRFLLPDRQGEKGIGRLMTVVVRRLLEEALLPQKMHWGVGRHKARIWHPSGSRLEGCESRILRTANLHRFQGCPLRQVLLGSSRL